MAMPMVSTMVMPMMIMVVVMVMPMMVPMMIVVMVVHWHRFTLPTQVPHGRTHQLHLASR